MSRRQAQRPHANGRMPPSASDGDSRCLELCPICRGAEVLRASGGGEELRGGLLAVQREALLTTRALIDHYLERLAHSESQGPDVEEIPID